LHSAASEKQHLLLSQQLMMCQQLVTCQLAALLLLLLLLSWASFKGFVTASLSSFLQSSAATSA
jgi:hypothetical protein